MAASDFINNVYGDATYYADQAAIYADTVASAGFTEGAWNLINWLTAGATGEGISKIAEQPNYNPTFAAQSSPDIDTPTVNADVVPTLAVGLGDISEFETVVFPDFEAIAPQLNFPAAVSLDEIDAPNNPPEINRVTIEDTEYPELRPLEDLPNILLPDDVGITPDFDIQFEETRPVAPTNTFSFSETQYESTMLNKAIELIESDLEDGGYGIREEDEQRLQNRARDRVSKASEAELKEADLNLSSRGFTLPTGAHNAMAARAAQNKTAQLSEVSNEVYLNHSNLTLQARQFAVQTTFTVQQYLIGFHQATQERSLRVNQLISEFGLSYFNANIEMYQMGIDAVRVQSDLFRNKLDASRLSLERFFANLEKARTQREINKDQIELYQAQFSAIEALTNIHNNKIRAAQLEISTQELKLRQYSEQNKWFNTLVDAQGQKIQNFRALTEAETVKMQAYRVQAQAHNTVLDGAKIRSDIQRDKIAAEIESANLKLREYEAEITRWQSGYRVALENAQITMSKHGIDVDKWRESQRLNFSRDELGLRSHDANIKNHINVARENYRLIGDAMNANLNLFSTSTGNIAKTADLQSNLATSSYNALNMISAIVEG